MYLQVHSDPTPSTRDIEAVTVKRELYSAAEGVSVSGGEDQPEPREKHKKKRKRKKKRYYAGVPVITLPPVQTASYKHKPGSPTKQKPKVRTLTEEKHLEKELVEVEKHQQMEQVPKTETIEKEVAEQMVRTETVVQQELTPQADIMTEYLETDSLDQTELVTETETPSQEEAKAEFKSQTGETESELRVPVIQDEDEINLDEMVSPRQELTTKEETLTVEDVYLTLESQKSQPTEEPAEEPTDKSQDIKDEQPGDVRKEITETIEPTEEVVKPKDYEADTEEIFLSGKAQRDAKELDMTVDTAYQKVTQIEEYKPIKEDVEKAQREAEILEPNEKKALPEEDLKSELQELLETAESQAAVLPSSVDLTEDSISEVSYDVEIIQKEPSPTGEEPATTKPDTSAEELPETMEALDKEFETVEAAAKETETTDFETKEPATEVKEPETPEFETKEQKLVEAELKTTDSKEPETEDAIKEPEMLKVAVEEPESTEIEAKEAEVVDADVKVPEAIEIDAKEPEMAKAAIIEPEMTEIEAEEPEVVEAEPKESKLIRTDDKETDLKDVEAEVKEPQMFEPEDKELATIEAEAKIPETTTAEDKPEESDTVETKIKELTEAEIKEPKPTEMEPEEPEVVEPETIVIEVRESETEVKELEEVVAAVKESEAIIAGDKEPEVVEIRDHEIQMVLEEERPVFETPKDDEESTKSGEEFSDFEEDTEETDELLRSALVQVEFLPASVELTEPTVVQEPEEEITEPQKLDDEMSEPDEELMGKAQIAAAQLEPEKTVKYEEPMIVESSDLVELAEIQASLLPATVQGKQVTIELDETSEPVTIETTVTEVQTTKTEPDTTEITETRIESEVAADDIDKPEDTQDKELEMAEADVKESTVTEGQDKNIDSEKKEVTRVTEAAEELDVALAKFTEPEMAQTEVKELDVVQTEVKETEVTGTQDKRPAIIEAKTKELDVYAEASEPDAVSAEIQKPELFDVQVKETESQMIAEQPEADAEEQEISEVEPQEPDNKINEPPAIEAEVPEPETESSEFEMKQLPVSEEIIEVRKEVTFKAHLMRQPHVKSEDIDDSETTGQTEREMVDAGEREAQATTPDDTKDVNDSTTTELEIIKLEEIMLEEPQKPVDKKPMPEAEIKVEIGKLEDVKVEERETTEDKETKDELGVEPEIQEVAVVVVKSKTDETATVLEEKETKTQIDGGEQTRDDTERVTPEEETDQKESPDKERLAETEAISFQEVTSTEIKRPEYDVDITKDDITGDVSQVESTPLDLDTSKPEEIEIVQTMKTTTVISQATFEVLDITDGDVGSDVQQDVLEDVKPKEMNVEVTAKLLTTDKKRSESEEPSKVTAEPLIAEEKTSEIATELIGTEQMPFTVTTEPLMGEEKASAEQPSMMDSQISEETVEKVSAVIQSSAEEIIFTQIVTSEPTEPEADDLSHYDVTQPETEDVHLEQSILTEHARDVIEVVSGESDREEIHLEAQEAEARVEAQYEIDEKEPDEVEAKVAEPRRDPRDDIHVDHTISGKNLGVTPYSPWTICFKSGKNTQGC